LGNPASRILRKIDSCLYWTCRNRVSLSIGCVSA
jgi:hypothetical protein